jgi:hypothetical protein
MWRVLFGWCVYGGTVLPFLTKVAFGKAQSMQRIKQADYCLMVNSLLMVCAPSAEQAMADVVSVYPTAINQNLAVLRAFLSQSMQRQNSISSL